MAMQGCSFLKERADTPARSFLRTTQPENVWAFGGCIACGTLFWFDIGVRGRYEPSFYKC